MTDCKRTFIDTAPFIYLIEKSENNPHYYKDLYPLNKEQYRIVKKHYIETGDVAEDFNHKGYE